MIKYYSDFNNSFNGRHIYINKKKYLLATLWCSVAAATAAAGCPPSSRTPGQGPDTRTTSAHFKIEIIASS